MATGGSPLSESPLESGMKWCDRGSARRSSRLNLLLVFGGCLGWTPILPAGTAESPPLSRVAIEVEAPGVVAGRPARLRITRFDGQPTAAPTRWDTRPPTRLFVRNEGTQENRENVTPTAGDAGVTEVTLPEAGAALIGAEFPPRVERVAAADFARVVNARLAGDARKAYDAKPPTGESRVRMLESATTLARTDTADGAPRRGSPTAVSKTGQRVEIRPLMDPSAIEVGGDLALRLYVDGDKRADATLVAVHIPSGARQTITPHPTAIANININQSGRWRLEMSALDPGPAGADADWILYSATLTFEVPAAGVKP